MTLTIKGHVNKWRFDVLSLLNCVSNFIFEHTLSILYDMTLIQSMKCSLHLDTINVTLN